MVSQACGRGYQRGSRHAWDRQLIITHVSAGISSSLAEAAFGAKHLADLGQEEDDFRTFHWDVAEWDRLDKRITSPVFECGGHKW